MPRRLLYALPSLMLLAAICLLPAPASAWNPNPAQPGKAVFYPDEVQLTVGQSLSPEHLPTGGTGFLLALPHAALPQSFSLLLNGRDAGGYYWLDEDDKEKAFASLRGMPVSAMAALPENETDPERKALLEVQVAVTESVAQIQGQLESVNSQLQLWRNMLAFFQGRMTGDVKRPFSPAEEANKLHEAYTKHMSDLHAEQARLQLANQDAGKALGKANRELARYDRSTGRHLVAIPYTGEQGGVVTLSYTNSLPATSRSSYRLNATPGTDDLTISQDALLRQTSGFTWDNVDLYISTLRRDRTLQPGLIRPWRVSLAPKNAPAPASRLRKDETAKVTSQMAIRQAPASGEADVAYEPAPPVPVQEEKGSFRLWSLGKQRIGHDNEISLPLSSDTHKVTYVYTLRPAINSKGFLTAELDLPEALELPPGPAQFSVDGALVARAQFAFNGKKGNIFFGTDPQVTATMRNLRESSGKEGFFSKDETRSWHWEITLLNTRTRPVDVVLEDPAPDSNNEAITVTVSSKPKAEQAVMAPERGGAKLYRWRMTLAPGAPQVVEHKVQLLTPQSKDTVLAPGR